MSRLSSNIFNDESTEFLSSCKMFLVFVYVRICWEQHFKIFLQEFFEFFDRSRRIPRPGAGSGAENAHQRWRWWWLCHYVRYICLLHITTMIILLLLSLSSSSPSSYSSSSSSLLRQWCQLTIDMSLRWEAQKLDTKVWKSKNATLFPLFSRPRPVSRHFTVTWGFGQLFHFSVKAIPLGLICQRKKKWKKSVNLQGITEESAMRNWK